jgi:6-phosphogluconolactonase
MILENKLKKLSNLIFTEIKIKILLRKKINILLTGGRNALKLYFFLNIKIKKLDLRKVIFWLTDERLNCKNKKESNYFSIKKVLFKKIDEKKYNFSNILYNLNDLKNSINKYEIFFPKKFDLMIITLGDDGHVASLFPIAKEESISENFIKAYVKSNKYKQRVSIKKKLFNKINKIFVLCFGRKKKNMYNKLIKSNFRTNLPADCLKNAVFYY